jgi:hypothetical protein
LALCTSALCSCLSSGTTQINSVRADDLESTRFLETLCNAAVIDGQAANWRHSFVGQAPQWRHRWRQAQRIHQHPFAYPQLSLYRPSKRLGARQRSLRRSATLRCTTTRLRSRSAQGAMLSEAGCVRLACATGVGGTRADAGWRAKRARLAGEAGAQAGGARQESRASPGVEQIRWPEHLASAAYISPACPLAGG